MKYGKEQVKDAGERYIVENGKVVKRYYVGEKDVKSITAAVVRKSIDKMQGWV